MVRTRKGIYVGNQEVKRRYIGNKLIFEIIVDMEDKDKVSGTEIFTNKADNSVVHVEVDGKSYRENDEPTPDKPSEIHSLNDFDVVSSVGRRNLLLNSEEEVKNNDYMIKEYTPITPLVQGEEYTLTICVTPAKGLDHILPILSSGHQAQSSLYFNGTSKQIVTRTFTASYYEGRSPEDAIFYANLEFYRFPNNGTVTGDTTIHWVKVEKGNKATLYTPAPEDITENDNHPLIDKINLSLSEPLRSVGDVKDRIYKDGDGMWKIERSVGETQLGASDIASVSIGAGNNVATTRKIDNSKLGHDAPLRSSHPGQMGGDPADTWRNVENRGTATINPGGSVWLSVDKENIDTVEKAKNWFEAQKTAGTPVTVQYALETPTTETLDQELQDKLNTLKSFQDSNYVYTISNNDISPTLHATFKSKSWYDDYQDALLK